MVQTVQTNFDEGIAFMIKGIILENEQLKGCIKILVTNEESTRLLSEEFVHLREIRKAICQKYETLTKEL